MTTTEISVGRRGATRSRRPRPASTAAVRVLSKIGFVVAALLVWQIAAAAGDLGAVPTPVDVGAAILVVFINGQVWAPLGVTLAAAALAFAVSTAIGVAVGFLLGASNLAYRLSVFVLDFCRTIPALGLMPLIVLVFGAKMQGTVVLAVIGAVWAVLLQTIYGVRDVDPVARDSFRSYRVRRIDVVFRLILPSAAPYIATGLRLAAAVALLITLSAEIIIPSPGIGQEIMLAQSGGAIPEMYAYIVLAGLLGVAINAVFVALEHVVLAWHPTHREESR
ncbi:ABC transporter permease subunit [Microbacterium horticulturae]|uniref:ABC transporter permease subunit n=1 Tax=Microbacterium horticulturae TaxID=3028316 RepID=A0ABY8BWD4_9MICO|nr:ABC transporter permease subunit [Microbacterium sp. KACC 23027]WEG08479.1 ABC transporter permease subunit [Microbacterium sp. KACC 23027]